MNANARAVIIMRIPQILLDALDEQATQDDISREEALRQAICCYTGAPYPQTQHPNIKYTNQAERDEANRTQSRNRMRAMRERKANT